MPQKITLSKDGQTETVIVETATMNDEYTIATGFDPSFCPTGMRDGIMFFSKDLSARIPADGEVSVERVEPTDQSVPEPDVLF